MASIFHEMALKRPDLKRKLAMAHTKKTPEQYVKEKFTGSLFMALTFGFAAFLFVQATEKSILIVPVVFVIAFYLLFQVFVRTVDVEINKRAKEIDREVLFAGRFLLVKLNAGVPLSMAISEAAKSYGVASQHFKEIVRDMELGTPLEDALDKASRYSPSEKFRRIIFQIGNALKIGVDISSYLEAILDEVAEEQLIEIKRYGKKLSGLTMFFMLFAIVVPSLGITLLITVVSFLNVKIDMLLFSVMLGGLAMLMGIFITIFKGARPNVNI